MFILIPYEVDVPQDRWPVVNWLIILATVCVFLLQTPDLAEVYGDANPFIQALSRVVPDVGNHGITNSLKLDGWRLKGLLGHMWLHAGILHLLGNMLFLWLFGNAVCAKVGNVRYLLLYVLFGVAAGVAHLLFSAGTGLGASGAINGVVGMYLVLFYENEVTCLFACWFILPYVHTFSVSGFWLILLWLFWDIIGAMHGGGRVGYFAHLGGFAAGFGIAMLMCYLGWIAMERYEGSLLQAWQKRRNPDAGGELDTTYAHLGLATATEPRTEPSPIQPAEPKPIPLPEPEPPAPRRSPPNQAPIRTVCACGRDITVSRQYAGKTVRCPACHQGIVIPPATDFFGPARHRSNVSSPLPDRLHDRSIRFTCACGKKIKAPARYAGRSGKCPRCGRRLRIPHPPA